MGNIVHQLADNRSRRSPLLQQQHDDDDEEKGDNMTAELAAGKYIRPELEK